MANDTWTAPSGPSAGVIGLAEMATQRTDNINVLALAVDGDTSGTTIKHRHLSGAAAARPAAGEAGRFYYATDTKTLSVDNGTTWDRIIEPVRKTADQTVTNSTTLVNEDRKSVV